MLNCFHIPAAKVLRIMIVGEPTTENKFVIAQKLQEIIKLIPETEQNSKN